MNPAAEFRTIIAAELAPRGLSVSNWAGGTRRSDNLLEIGTSPSTVLYVKASSTPRGFWGLTKNQLDKLRLSNSRWYCIFLHRSTSAGYVFSGDEIQAWIDEGAFNLAKDGDYKITQGDDVFPSHRFGDIENLVARIL